MRIWDANGQIVSSDKRQLIGDTYALGADEREVLRTGGVCADARPRARASARCDRRPSGSTP
ncbi:MAG: hypothetical protein ACXVQU_11415 [Actinomycetota bacterium]